MWAAPEKLLKHGEDLLVEKGTSAGRFWENGYGRGDTEEWLEQRQQWGRELVEFQSCRVTKLTAHRQDAEELAAEVTAAPRSSGSPSPQKAQKGRSRLETSASERGAACLPTRGQAQRVHCVCLLPRPALSSQTGASCWLWASYPGNKSAINRPALALGTR